MSGKGKQEITPEILAAIKAQMQSLGGDAAFEVLPTEVQNRVNALRRLQLEHAKLDVEYHKELRALDLKFHNAKKDHYKKRSDIIVGTYEPTAEEAKPLEEEEETEAPAAPSEKPISGVPDFWLTALQSHSYIAQIIEAHDAPILSHLTDISIEHFTEPEIGFKLTFKFSKNEFFKNEELVKTYYLNYDLEDGELQYEGPNYHKAEGTPIDWYDGKDVTVRIEKKKQKKKGGKDAGKTRTITKTVPQDSFFHFFKPPQLPETEDADEETPELEMQRSMLSQDFDLGDLLKDQIIPNAVLFFTGEATQDYDDDDNFGEGEDGDYGEEDEDDEDDEPEPPTKGGKGGKGGKALPAPGKGATAPGGQNPECKQQ